MGTSKDFDAPRTPEWRNLKRDVTQNSQNPIPLPPPDPWLVPLPTDVSQPPVLTPLPTVPQALRPNVQRVAATLGRFVRAQYGGGTPEGGGAGGNGARSHTHARRSAQRVGQNLGGFFSAVGSGGLRAVAESFGLGSLEGKSASEIAVSLTDVLGGPSTTHDDVDARNALARLMNELLEDVPEDQVTERLERIPRGHEFADILYRFFGYYIFEQFNRVFFSRLRRTSPANAEQYLQNGLHCILWKLRDRTQSADVRNIDWSGGQGAALITDIMNGTFEIFGGEA